MLDTGTRTKLLRVILLADCIVLLILGLLLIFATESMFSSFKVAFGDPRSLGAAKYIAGMWGALLATMGLGYGLAASQPAKARSWVVMGLARAVIEVLVSVLFIVQGAVSFRTAGLGIFLAVWFAIAYVLLMPQAERASPSNSSLAKGGA